MQYVPRVEEMQGIEQLHRESFDLRRTKRTAAVFRVMVVDERR
jgi:hypothetical protein